MFKRFWWVFLVMLPVGALSGLMIMAVVTYVMPRKYESQAVIEVKPLPSGAHGDIGFQHTTPQNFYATEFEKIKSRAILAKVVGKLELTRNWGVDEDTAIQMLRSLVSPDNIRGTDLISIRVRHTDREGARDIAAELAKKYREYRVEILNREAERHMNELNKAVKEQEEKVEERRKVLATIFRTGSLLAGPDMAEADAEKSMDVIHAQDVTDAKRDFETDQALLQTMKLKQIGLRITDRMQDESVVIHEEPQIPQVPVSPNVTLNLLLGAVGGFLLSPLVALPLMILLNLMIPAKLDGPPSHTS